MVGRADKGLFLTTGGFTKDARREAVRDGAPAIDLIDGAGLCDLLKDYRLGVETVEVIRPKPEFFERLWDVTRDTRRWSLVRIFCSAVWLHFRPGGHSRCGGAAAATPVRSRDC